MDLGSSSGLSEGPQAAAMQAGASQYVVTRSLYSEESFAEEHQKVYRQRKTALEHVKQCFT